ncbi:ribonuclease H-like domain-containing protein [Tanacetum coccineum]
MFLDDSPDIPTQPIRSLPVLDTIDIHDAPISPHFHTPNNANGHSTNLSNDMIIPSAHHESPAYFTPNTFITGPTYTCIPTFCYYRFDTAFIFGPIIIPGPPENLNPISVHPMVTRFYVGSNWPTERLILHVSLVSPLPKSYHDAFHDSNWQNAMYDEYYALIKNQTWTFVPHPSDTNVVRCVDVDETFSPVVKPVYMHLPPGFRDSAHPDYGMDTTYLLLYVDDIVLATSSEILLQRLIGSLHQEFSMTDLGSLNYFLGISVTRDSTRMFLSRRKYAIEILERAGMVSCNSNRMHVDIKSKLGYDGDPVSNPTLYQSLTGSLQYLTFTHSDISYAVQQFFSSSTTHLIAYSDAYWAGFPTTRRSTSGYCVFLGNNLLSWSSKRQPMLSCSSAEAKYRSVTNVVAETCWLRNLLRELHSPLSYATLVYCDNVSAMYLSSNPVQH